MGAAKVVTPDLKINPMLKYFFLFFFLSTHLLFADIKLMKYIPIDTEESLKRIQEGAIVIDVRYPNEHNKIRIENSYNIPFKEITVEKINSINPDNKDIIIHCTAGITSKKVADNLVAQGYQGTIYEMDKGLIDWVNLGFKTEQGI